MRATKLKPMARRMLMTVRMRGQGRHGETREMIVSRVMRKRVMPAQT